jgi:3-carboxy-cis,cis-muconate cycloisomerase
MSVRLIESLSTTEPLAQVFSDPSVLQAMLDFEVALARAEGELKIIPQSAARTIARVARAENFDAASLARETLRAGTPGIPLVKALRKKVLEEDVAAADFVHWGATSQDVSDTALILLLKQSAPILSADLDRLEAALEALAIQHKDTVMLGRTLLQPAPPITFGLKAAGWSAAVRRGHARLRAAFADALILQLGGASGTLAALGNYGDKVGQQVAKRLKLGYPDAPWHTHRDRLAAVVCACGVLVGSVGKIARDISLLMQAEVGEVSEPGGSGRGGSSTMPQKCNPIASTIALAAGYRVPALVASFLSQMVQEHERAVGGSQAEWPTVAHLIQSTGVAIVSIAEAAEGLTINRTRMRENLESTHGAVYAEKAALLLSRKLGRERAHSLLQQATRPQPLRKETLAEILAQSPEVKSSLGGSKELRTLEDPEDYLGLAREFSARLRGPSRRRPRRKQ